jgi:hypothetical protein
MLHSAPLGMHYILKALLHTHTDRQTSELLVKLTSVTLLHQAETNCFETRTFRLIYII